MPRSHVNRLIHVVSGRDPFEISDISVGAVWLAPETVIPPLVSGDAYADYMMWPDHIVRSLYKIQSFIS